MPKFHVIDTFTIESRQLFVLAGAIVEGEIRPGMLVRVPFDPSMAATARIHSVEFARRSGGREDVCLCIRCADAEALALWQSLSIDDETLEVMADGAE